MSGFAYTASITDAYTRKIVGAATRASMRTDELPLEAFEHVLHSAGDLRGEGLIHHSDRGVQYVFIRYGEALAEAGVDPSVGSVGDSYDNALAETINGLYKTELIYPHWLWRSVVEVELATFRWVYWWNNQRLDESLGYITPQAKETLYYRQTATQTMAAKLAEQYPGRFRPLKPRGHRCVTRSWVTDDVQSVLRTPRPLRHSRDGAGWVMGGGRRASISKSSR